MRYTSLKVLRLFTQLVYFFSFQNKTYLFIYYFLIFNEKIGVTYSIKCANLTLMRKFRIHLKFQNLTHPFRSKVFLS